jgi:hypothetical protein
MVAARTAGSTSDYCPFFQEGYLNAFFGSRYGCPTACDSSSEDQDIRGHFLDLIVQEGIGPFQAMA